MGMEKINARECVVKILKNGEAASFVEKYHKQKSVSIKTKITSIGIFYKHDLVGVAQFCYPRTSKMKKEYSTELLRLCFKNDVRVVGGASKLVSFYIKTFEPADIFTYQDTTGKNSKVYEHCGFKLVRQDKEKSYIVAPGKTIQTGERKEVLGVPYAVQYGPDRILGTKLGEKFHSADHPTKPGKRKTNIELFVEELGWHIETTSGDKVYEWVNPNKTYYTYKITATDSDKYYYGVSHVKKGNATIADCLNDGYYGSGGANENNKFKDWKKKHSKNLQKTVVEIFNRKSYAFNSEKELIGNLWETDPLCLNSCVGGKDGGKTSNSFLFIVKVCPIHGETSHQGETCLACVKNSTFTLKYCDKHGETIFNSNSCCKCNFNKNVSVKVCEKHGETKFVGNSCYKCINENIYSKKECSQHGLTTHQGNFCMKCAANKRITVEMCKIHGETKFFNNVCVKCKNAKNLSKNSCKKHGKTFYSGGKCLKCMAKNSWNEKVCEIHGKTKFHGKKCQKCLNESNYSTFVCKIHGETKFVGSSCCKCASNSRTSVKICKIHGETFFRGDSCCKCSGLKSSVKSVCKIHGETSHQAGECLKCRGSSLIEEKLCDVHGKAKFKKGKCCKCSVGGSINLKFCDIHGETKFSGSSCRKCASMKTAHKRFHNVKFNPECQYCVK